MVYTHGATAVVGPVRFTQCKAPHVGYDPATLPYAPFSTVVHYCPGNYGIEKWAPVIIPGHVLLMRAVRNTYYWVESLRDLTSIRSHGRNVGRSPNGRYALGVR